MHQLVQLLSSILDYVFCDICSHCKQNVLQLCHDEDRPYRPVLYAILVSLYLASLFPKDRTVVIEVIKGFVLLLANPKEWSIFRDYYARPTGFQALKLGKSWSGCRRTEINYCNRWEDTDVQLGFKLIYMKWYLCLINIYCNSRRAFSQFSSFKICGSTNFFVDQERRATDFIAPKLLKGTSGCSFWTRIKLTKKSRRWHCFFPIFLMTTVLMLLSFFLMS